MYDVPYIFGPSTHLAFVSFIYFIVVLFRLIMFLSETWLATITNMHTIPRGGAAAFMIFLVVAHL